MPAAASSRLPLSGIVHLLIIYVVWGSTYLAIRVAVREGAGWGPFWLGASRVLVAGILLMLLAALRGRRLKPSRRDLGVLAVSGLLMWVGGNGGVNWAEQRVDSGLVALVVGAMPLWVALMEAALDRRAPSFLLIASMVTGLLGVALLSAPLLRQGLHGDLLGIGVVLLGSVSWGAGSVFLRRRPVKTPPLVTSSLQQLIGGVGFSLIALLFAEPLPRPLPSAWAAWAYLVVFGSLLAFSSFIRALELLPTTVVMTYSYVNPVIAVILGRLILAEPITPWTVGGMALILVGVVGVFRDKARS